MARSIKVERDSYAAAGSHSSEKSLPRSDRDSSSPGAGESSDSESDRDLENGDGSLDAALQESLQY